MKLISIIILMVAFVFGIIEMNKSSSISKGEQYNKLSSKDKKEVIQKLKHHWKTFIIILAMLFAMVLIILSTYMGKGTTYDEIISIVTIVVGAISILLMLVNKKKFNEDINRYFS